MWFFRALSSAIFLLSIILSIPIAFDVGGRECGLAFSLSLFYFYFFYSTIRLATPDHSRIRWAIVQMIGMAQWILLPGLLIWSMNRFAVDSNSSGDWVARTFDGKRAENATVKEWIFGSGGLLEMLTVGTWDKLLRYSTPFFQLAEGFCSLLVIQAAGQITRWLVNRGRSDAWMVCTLRPIVVFNLADVSRSACWSCPPQLSPAPSTSCGELPIFQRSVMLMRR
jgi:ICE2